MHLPGLQRLVLEAKRTLCAGRLSKETTCKVDILPILKSRNYLSLKFCWKLVDRQDPKKHIKRLTLNKVHFVGLNGAILGDKGTFQINEERLIVCFLVMLL